MIAAQLLCMTGRAGLQPGSVAVKAFWQALATVELDGDLLQLPDGVYFLRQMEYGSRMMWRDVYGQLMDIAEDLLAGGCKRMVVRGMPGIGKSWWLFLLLREAARRGITVVLQHFCMKRRFCFSGECDKWNGKPQYLTIGCLSFCSLLSRVPRTLLRNPYSS